MAGLVGWGGGVRGRLVLQRLRAAGGGKGGGGGGGGKAAGKASPAKAKKAKEQAPVGPTVDKAVRAKTVLAANILKEGADPSIRPDSEYPTWLFPLLNRPLPLSELDRLNPETMTMPELQRFVKLDNRRRIKENNTVKSKS
ncbi:hypothetical protein GOP47_0001302 [Adiantum capillus-veneris]|uniref:Large ribosomal subunit protein mL54 n=1 Tax=Adiantum capillus-veneris TaxID=13818 RepID=A0A9D4V8N8_ADICA|nr:hypothetical protein GOP47_0001302 [Adiantum capillus-veneris]